MFGRATHSSIVSQRAPSNPLHSPSAFDASDGFRRDQQKPYAWTRHRPLLIDISIPMEPPLDHGRAGGTTAYWNHAPAHCARGRVAPWADPLYSGTSHLDHAVWQPRPSHACKHAACCANSGSAMPLARSHSKAQVALPTVAASRCCCVDDRQNLPSRGALPPRLPARRQRAPVSLARMLLRPTPARHAASRRC